MANPFDELFASIRPAFIDIVDRKRIGTLIEDHGKHHDEENRKHEGPEIGPLFFP